MIEEVHVLSARAEAERLLIASTDDYSMLCLRTLSSELNVLSVRDIKALEGFTSKDRQKEKSVREGAAYLIEKISNSCELLGDDIKDYL